MIFRSLMLSVLLFALLFSVQSQALSLAENLIRVGPKISHPWGISFINDKDIVVTARGGAMYLINIETGDTKTITGLPEVFARRQGGLLDVLAQDGGLYFCYSRPVEGGAATALMKANLNGSRLIQQQVLFTANTPQTGGHHFGCRISIAGGWLYLSIGDRGNRDDAQVMESHSGSVIRLPLIAGEGDDAMIFTKGHRNPQGMAVHPKTGEIWINEHGPKGGDEINILMEGKNYGWPIVTHGREYYGAKVGDGITSAHGYADPVWVWVPSIAPSGMAFYQGQMFPEWQGDLLVTSLKFRSLYHVEIENGLPVRETPLLKGAIGRLRDIEIAPDGSIFLLNDEASGGVWRLSR
jgi:glucose/arabinose dehydrogenase